MRYCIILTKNFTSVLINTCYTYHKANNIVKEYIEKYSYDNNLNLEYETEQNNDRIEFKVYSYIINWRGWLWSYPETNKKHEFTITIDTIFDFSTNPPSFIEELKNKLKQPNYGLRQIKQYVFV